MRSIDLMCFSQMNPSYYAICTIGGGALRQNLLKIPKNRIVKSKTCTPTPLEKVRVYE